MDTQSKIEEYITSYNDWRGERLSELRRLINETSPELTEEFKWGVPVWKNKKLVCAISAFKDHVKINFFQGAHLPDPSSIFNSGLDSKDHRSVNFAENDAINTSTLAEIIRAAAAFSEK